MVSSRPKIWVKSYPNPEEILALTDLNSDGIEVFLHRDKKVNKKCLEICCDNYPEVAIEMFDVGMLRGKKIIYDLFSDNGAIRQVSRSYLRNILELTDKFDVKHVQLNLNDGYKWGIRERMDHNKDIILYVIMKFFEELNCKVPLFFENIFPIAQGFNDIRFSSIGHNLSDFKDFPLAYDLSHHAISLDTYTKAMDFGLVLSNKDVELAEKVKEKDITAVIIDELKKRKEKIYFAHFDNAASFEIGKRVDGVTENSEDELIDLEQILPILLRKCKNVSPEVADDDYVKRPNLRRWIRRLQCA